MSATKQIKSKSGEVVEYNPGSSQPALPQNQSVEALISQAISSNVPVETLERLLAMRTQLKAEAAKEAFDADMASFQGECPTIKKTKSVKTRSGVVAYSYAPLDSIVSQVRDLLQKYGFSYSIQTETLDGKVKATCYAKHRLGHSESSSMEVPLGNKTDIMSNSQVVAAALTFAKRYAFCNTFGIMTGDEDKEEIIKDQEPKKDATNYIDKLKMILYKQGGKTLPEALEVYNRITGLTAKAMPKTNEEAKEMIDNLLDSPAFNQ